MCFSNHRTARGAESGVVERASPTPTHDEKPCLGGELFKNGNRGAVELDLTDRDTLHEFALSYLFFAAVFERQAK